MLPACDDVSEAASTDAGADIIDGGEWVLLLQIGPNALATLQAEAEPAALPWMRFSGEINRLYFWIRKGDLLQRDFTRVCVQWQGDYTDDDPYDPDGTNDEDG